MKLSEFSDIVKAKAEALTGGFTYRAQNLSQYNADKNIEKVFLLVPPRNWSVVWRDQCSHRETVQFMVGIPVALKQAGSEQYLNYSPITARNDMIAAAEAFVADLMTHEKIRVVDDGLVVSEFLNNPIGASTNNVVWLKWSLQVELY